MTLPLVVLVAVVLMGVATIWLLLRSRHAPDGDPTRAPQAVSLDRYRVMGRILAQEDIDFVCRRGVFGEENRNWFLSRRRRIMKSYLRELRRDFGRVFSACRSIAPYVEDPDFGSELLHQSVKFYCAYALLMLRLSTNRTSQVRLDTGELVTALRGLREGAGEALRSSRQLSYQASSDG